MTRVTMATIGVGLFALGGAVGRYAAPARVVTVERAVTSEQDVHAATAAVANAARVQTEADDSHEHIRIVRVYEKPDGERETETEEHTIRLASKRAEHDESQAKTQTQIEYRDRVEYRDRERIVESQKRSNWSATALVGLRFDRAETAFGGTLMRRIVGPVEVGAWATKSGGIWAGGLAIGVRW